MRNCMGISSSEEEELNDSILGGGGGGEGRVQKLLAIGI